MLDLILKFVACQIAAGVLVYIIAIIYVKFTILK